MEFSHQFIHHVYFWLKNPLSDQDRSLLVEGLHTLNGIKGIVHTHIGIPASTDRDVIDTSYAVSWLVVFDHQAAQDAYQVDPMHLQFVEDCGRLWSKVLVYDSVPVVY